MLAHEYFHVLQFNLVAGAEQHFASSPAWLNEGSAEYARGLYLREQGMSTGEQQRSRRWLQSTSYNGGLQTLAAGSFGSRGGAEYSLAALAVEWLEGHAAAVAEQGSFEPVARDWPDRVGDAGAYIRYYELLSSSGGWEEAFETAFGITAQAFYEEFDDYRTASTASRVPHLADEHDEPFLVLLGDIAEEDAATVRADFDAVQALFRERFGGPAADYSIYFVGPTESALNALQSTLGWDPGPAPLTLTAGPNEFVLTPCVAIYEDLPVMIVFQTCGADLPRRIGSDHFHGLRNQLLGASARSWWSGFYRGEPIWLRNGMEEYAEYAYLGLAGDEDPDWLFSRFAAYAVQTAEPLSSMEAPAEANAIGVYETRALGFLASDWLADQAGETTFLEFYRLLRSSADWRETFAGAFGMTIDDFYAAFEPHRREVAPAIPHRADERLEPVCQQRSDSDPGQRSDVDPLRRHDRC